MLDAKDRARYALLNYSGSARGLKGVAIVSGCVLCPSQAFHPPPASQFTHTRVIPVQLSPPVESPCAPHPNPRAASPLNGLVCVHTIQFAMNKVHQDQVHRDLEPQGTCGLACGGGYHLAGVGCEGCSRIRTPKLLRLCTRLLRCRYRVKMFPMPIPGLPPTTGVTVDAHTWYLCSSAHLWRAPVPHTPTHVLHPP